ncbi:hypothetical protein D3C71_1779410 [compost metagenome]
MRTGALTVVDWVTTTFSRMLLTTSDAISRSPLTSMVELMLSIFAAVPTAMRSASSAPPMAALPSLKIRLCPVLLSVPTPKSSRSRAAMVAAVVIPATDSARFSRLPAWMATWSP